MPDTDAHAVRQPKRTVTLADGREILIRFDLETLWNVEEEFGSLDDFLQALAPLTDGDRSDAAVLKGKVFQPILRALACVMPDDELRDPRRLAREIPPDAFTDAAEALGLALAEAMFLPSADGAADGRPNLGPKRPKANGSRGRGSTTRRRSSSDAPTSSSGG
jgi:hypothetical protein